MGLVGGQERGRQGGRGRLALRPGDPDRRRWAQAQEEIRLADEGGRSGSAGAGGGQASESITQARFRRREVGVDRGRRRDEVSLLPGACRVNRRPRHHGQALLEARKKVTPRRPARIARIQKRSVIFSSSQPLSSKWWWIGDIRKIRLPPVHLK